MRIDQVSENPPDTGLGDLRSYVGSFAKNVMTVVNGNLTFSDNFKCVILEVEFNDANTDKLIAHTLGRRPIGYILIDSDEQTTLYSGSNIDNKTVSTITLRASAIATTTILVF